MIGSTLITTHLPNITSSTVVPASAPAPTSASSPVPASALAPAPASASVPVAGFSSFTTPRLESSVGAEAIRAASATATATATAAASFRS
ncbi:hypothetical protein G6F44_013734 [Rhizopus delemar]|nr:hypothetical protein G6F44_013734 [Rhizopus delemar]